MKIAAKLNISRETFRYNFWKYVDTGKIPSVKERPTLIKSKMPDNFLQFLIQLIRLSKQRK